MFDSLGDNQDAPVAERIYAVGFYPTLRRFNSVRAFQFYWRSSMAEQAAYNRSVVGSSPSASTKLCKKKVVVFLTKSVRIRSSIGRASRS